jgi:transcription elongation factor Elf1
MKPTTDEKRTQDETACPRCGGLATWGYADIENTQVTISCADCGRMELGRTEFDVAQAELADADE